MSEKTPSFYEIVRLFRGRGPQFAMRVLYAAIHWSDDRLNEAERSGEVPGQRGETVTWN